MEKTKMLNDLFADWEKAQCEESDESCKKTISGNNIKKYFFERDGIISEFDFEREKLKILFVSAESNYNSYVDAKANGKSDYRAVYESYFNSGKDEWKGKMKERICALYGFITGQVNVDAHLLAKKFAVMDINKRGGEAKLKGGAHMIEYVNVYHDFLRREIEIINPDMVVWIGTNIYRLGIPEMLGAKRMGEKLFFEIEGKAVPIISVWQTSYYQARIEPLLPEECGSENKIIRKLCAKAKSEMDKLA